MKQAKFKHNSGLDQKGALVILYYNHTHFIHYFRSYDSQGKHVSVKLHLILDFIVSESRHTHRSLFLKSSIEKAQLIQYHRNAHLKHIWCY